MGTVNAESRPVMRRIVIVGTTGTGKTTFAGHLAGRLGVPHVELDALHWEPNWTPADLARFRERVTRAVSDDAWVVDGNYHVVRDLVWLALALFVLVWDRGLLALDRVVSQRRSAHAA